MKSFVMIMYMTTKKHLSRKNSSRSNKKQRQQRRQKLFIGGTCSMCGSCMNQNNQMPSLFRGGKNYTWKRRSGGNDTPSFNGLPQRYYYQQNDFAQDPTSNQIASRQLANIKGGKNKTKRSARRGGSLGFSYFNGQAGLASNFNPTSSIGELMGSQLGSNYISTEVNTNTLTNPSVFSQPVESKYNVYNMPMA